MRNDANDMCLLKEMSLQKMDVTVGEKYWSINEGSFRVWYNVEEQMRCITIVRSEAPSFLKKHGLIDFYNNVSGSMFKKAFVTIADRRTGCFEMIEKPVEFTWQEIEISREMAHKIARHNEYEIANKKIGSPVLMALFMAFVAKIYNTLTAA